MAGALTIDTLNNSAGVFATNNAFQGIAKAWVSFQGGASGSVAGRINKSFNVSSITVISSNGQYQVNFAQNMADANYASLYISQSNTIANFDGSTIAGPQTVSYSQVCTGKGVGNSGNAAYGVFAAFFD